MSASSHTVWRWALVTLTKASKRSNVGRVILTDTVSRWTLGSGLYRASRSASGCFDGPVAGCWSLLPCPAGLSGSLGA